MGVWTECCICCGLAFEKYNQAYFENSFDGEKLESLENAKLTDTRWLCDAIGINRFEKIIPLGKYDDYGAFEGKHGERNQNDLGIFNTVTNFINDNYEEDDDYGVVCHRACFSLVQLTFDVRLSFGVIWPLLLRQHYGNVLTSVLDYGVVKEYKGQDFDLLQMVQDKNQWMLANPLKSLKSQRRILKIVKPLARLHK